jgi:hypothetical protein
MGQEMLTFLATILVIAMEIVTISIYFLYLDAKREKEKREFEDKLKKRRGDK